MKLKFNKLLVAFLCCHFLVWTLIPCLRQILPMDTMEAIVWGALKEFGTTKHPPLSGWLAYVFWQIGGQKDIALYMLSQVCVITGLIYIYRIGKIFLSENKALLATMLMEGIVYYQFSSVEYNVNVVSLALWPMCAFYFIRAMEQNKWADWVLFGVCSGFNVLNKYVCVILYISLFLYLILTKNGRATFKKKGLYVSIFIGFLIFLPHLVWLCQNDFFVVDYFLGRGGSAQYHWTNHLFYPIRFLIAQVAFFLPAVLIYLFVCRDKENQESNKPQSVLLFFIGCLPLLITVGLSCALGIKFKTAWGFPLLYLSTVCLFYFVPRAIGTIQAKRLTLISFVLIALMGISYMGQIAFNRGRNFQTVPTQLVKQFNSFWEERYPTKPLISVGGDFWWVSAMYVYHPEVQKVLYEMTPKTNPWFNSNQIVIDGLMVMTDSLDCFTDWQKRYPTLKGPYRYEHTTENWFGQKKNQEMYFGFLRE